MAKLPETFDWRKSPAHIDLLGKFVKPRNLAQVMSWQYLNDALNENPKEAIERFVRDEALVASNLNETLDCAFTAAELKKIAKEQQSVKQTGSKAELAERLIAADRSKMETLVSKIKVMKCSTQALKLVEEFEQRKQQALDEAKQQSFEALLRGDAKGAYKAFLAYQKAYVDSEFQSQTVVIDGLCIVLSSEPKVLGEMSQSDLTGLRAAACMPDLWFGESSANWLPPGFTTHLQSNAIAINYLKCNARMREDLARYSEFAERVRLVFDENDIDSCELCLKLNGKVFDRAAFPELPCENCTSETGCKGRIESDFETEREGVSFKVIVSDEDSVEVNPIADDDAFEKLSQIKKMLDNSLITEEQYEKKKSEILSRL